MDDKVSHSFDPDVRLGRRAFLTAGSLMLVGTRTRLSSAQEASVPVSVTCGLVADLHSADKAPASTRFYRQTIAKLAEAGSQFERDKPDFVVCLGDLIDAADSVQLELDYLRTIKKQLDQIPFVKHYVLGNHCVDTLTKKEFLQEVEQANPHFSFDAGGFHFVVLDACFRTDGQSYGRKNFDWTDANIPQSQLDWLKQDLKDTPHPTIVFAHQRLDEFGVHSVRNAEAVREVLQQSTRVLAVFQGHSHKNDYQEINGIHYCTLVAMVEGSGAENNGYATLKVHRDGALQLTGFRKQANYQWP